MEEILHVISSLRSDISKDLYSQMKGIVRYLRKNGLGDEQIVQLVKDWPKDEMDIDHLPDSLWNKSLLKKDKYYFHEELQIREGGSFFNEKTGEYSLAPYTVELKIQYTKEDLVRYLYRQANTVSALQDVARDAGACEYFLNKYKTLTVENTEVESIDLLLFLIDYAISNAKNETRFMTLLEIVNKYFSECYPSFEARILQCVYSKANQIIR